MDVDSLMALTVYKFFFTFFLIRINFFWFGFLIAAYVLASFAMHYIVILYLKSNNFIIFGNEQNLSKSEGPKTKSFGIVY